jgi:PEGA domain.
MYQHLNTRKQFIKRVITYCLMTLAVIIGVAGTTAWILGYRLNFQEEQSVERITLLQFGSFPTGANVFVNDQQLNFNTPGRYDSARPGENELKYQLEGYHNWQTTVHLEPAEVRWMNYARMVPNEIVSTDSLEVVNFYQAVSAPNGNLILLHEVAETPKFKIIDISDPNNAKVTEIEIPEAVLVGEVRNIHIVEWDSNSTFILLNQDGNILRLDRRDPTNTINLTDFFGVKIDDPHFLNGNSNIVFGLTDTSLRRFDIRAKTTSAPLVTDVVSYEAYGDGKLSYVSQIDGKQNVGVFFKDKNYTMGTFDDIKETFASFVNYYRDDFFIFARDSKIEIIKHPFSNNSSEVTILETSFKADHLFHNGGGRMILATSGNEVFTYDLETKVEYGFDLESFDKKPFWLDDFHLGYVHDGELKMIEFSGDNRESLVPATNFGVFSSNNERLFTFRKTDNGAVFVDSSMLAAKQIN